MKTGQECKDFSMISTNFRGTMRFYTDLLSIFGAKPFQAIHRYFNFFGLFKLFRVKRIGVMIAQANVDDITKALMNLAKIFFYLFFYLHLVACYWWIFLGTNAPQRFYSNSDLNAYYEYSVDGNLGEPFKVNGKTV